MHYMLPQNSQIFALLTVLGQFSSNLEIFSRLSHIYSQQRYSQPQEQTTTGRSSLQWEYLTPAGMKALLVGVSSEDFAQQCNDTPKNNNPSDN